jgi:hypothetical protein
LTSTVTSTATSGATTTTTTSTTTTPEPLPAAPPLTSGAGAGAAPPADDSSSGAQPPLLLPTPSIELFFVLNTRGTRVAWLLEELQAPYTHVVPSLGSWVAATDLTNRELAQAVYNKSEI